MKETQVLRRRNYAFIAASLAALSILGFGSYQLLLVDKDSSKNKSSEKTTDKLAENRPKKGSSVVDSDATKKPKGHSKAPGNRDTKEPVQGLENKDRSTTNKAPGKSSLSDKGSSQNNSSGKAEANSKTKKGSAKKGAPGQGSSQSGSSTPLAKTDSKESNKKEKELLSFKGRVVDSEQRPIPDVQIYFPRQLAKIELNISEDQLRRETDPKKREEIKKRITKELEGLKEQVLGVTDNNGEFHLEKLTNDQLSLKLMFHPKDPFFQKKSVLIPNQDPSKPIDFGTIVLARSGGLDLTISHAQSKSLEGAIVQLLTVSQYKARLASAEAGTGLSLMDQVIERRVAEKGSTASLKLTNIKSGEYYALALQVGSLHSIPKKIKIEDGKRAFLDLELRSPATITMDLQDEQGQAIVGATAYWGSDLTMDEFIDEKTTLFESDESGRIQASGLWNKQFKLIVRAEGFAKQVVTFNPFVESDRSKTITLKQANSVTGRVLVNGKALEFATVSVLKKGDDLFADPLIIESSDEKGQFRLKGLAKGEYRLEIEQEGYQKITKPLKIKGEEGVVDLGDFELKQKSTPELEVRVVDSFGKDVQDFEVFAQKKGEKNIFGIKQASSEQGLAKLIDLERTEYLLIIKDSQERLLAYKPYIIGADSPKKQSVNFQLTNKRGQLAGSIKDQNGDAVTAGYIVLFLAKNEVGIIMKSVTQASFEFKDLLPGRYKCQYLDETMKERSGKVLVEIKDGESTKVTIPLK